MDEDKLWLLVSEIEEGLKENNPLLVLDQNDLCLIFNVLAQGLCRRPKNENND